MKKIDFITLGCSKNLVDSERLISRLESCGYEVTHEPGETTGDIVIVNTCGFIGDAKEESINTILEFAQAKTEGRIEQLYVMGCLSERYRKELEKEIPEVDNWFGKFDFTNLIDFLGKTNKYECGYRHITTPRHYAYLKISEGCDRRCSYCAIPLITGRHKSRPIEEILNEVRWLVSQGVKELQIIAQELTYYGIDLYKRRNIAELIDKIADIEGVEWIRLHYAYPTDFPMDLLDVMTKHDNICKYLDIALQHISDKMLSSMHRNITKQQTLDLIQKIRARVPGIHLRTTLMVGFPGETEEDFNELVHFVQETRFERMGAFAYCEEEGTYSADHLLDNVLEETKQMRLDNIMRIQQDIAADLQIAKVGRIMKVIIDRTEGDYWIGRTEYDSPDIDPEVLIKRTTSDDIIPGNYYNVKITDCEEFDLYGKVIS